MNYTIHPDARAALFDVDGTLTRTGQVWRVLLESHTIERRKRRWLYATAIPHYILSKMRLMSQSGFRDRWVRLMAWLIAGWTDEQAQILYEQTVATSMVPALRTDVWDLLKQHKAAGHPVILVSTMFAGIVDRFAQHVGADVGLGSVVEFQNGVCMGHIEGKTCSGGRKVEFAQRYIAQHYSTISLTSCVAYADSRSDIPFLEGVGFPVATYPDAAMRAAAQERGWSIHEGNRPNTKR